MHNRDLNALQFQTITVRHHEHATPFYTVKYGPILGSAIITSSTWATNNSGLAITNKTATTTATSAKFTASSAGIYTAINTVTDSDGEIIQRKIILVYTEATTLSPQYVYSGTPTVPTNLDLPWISIEEFGALEGVGNAAVNDVAYADAAAWLALQTEAKAIVWSPGVWECSVCPNWAVSDHAQLIAMGVVRWRYTGTGDAFILDGGATGGGITNLRIGRFLIEAHKDAGDGVYIRAVHRSWFSFNVRGCGTTQAALRTEWCVVDEFQFTTSVNEGGWYNDGSGQAEPLYGIYLDERASGEATSYCSFFNPIIEGVGIGGYIDEAIGNQFYGGTMEACVTYGIQFTANALWNKCYGADFEANGTADILCQGDNNFFSGVDTLALITVTTGAKGNQFIAGSHSQITIDSGAVGNLTTNITVNRFGDGTTYTNNGGATNKDLNVYDFGNSTWLS